jgi:hypothetical protein
MGNGDGSQDVVLSTDEHELTADEIAQRIWEQGSDTCLAIGDDGHLTRIDARLL